MATDKTCGGWGRHIRSSCTWSLGSGVSWSKPPLPRFVTRRLSHITSPTVSHTRLKAARPPTPWPETEPPLVKTIRPQLFHSSGLLPASQVNAKCLVSSVFTWTKFADRSLTLPELLWAWDFSQTE
eukprot:scaffold98941_cov50-Attheya_sp.AAC.2